MELFEIECPACGAAPWVPCKDDTEGRAATFPHQARIVAARRSQTPDRPITHEAWEVPAEGRSGLLCLIIGHVWKAGRCTRPGCKRKMLT